VEYDLKRTYGYEKREEKRRSYSRRVGISVSVLIIFIILGAIYLKNYETPSPELTVSKQINSTIPTNSTNLSRLSRSESVRGEMGSLFHRDSTNSTNLTHPINPRNPTNPTNPISPTNQKNSIISTAQAAEIENPSLPVIVATTTQKVELPPQPQSSITPLPNDLATHTPNGPTNPTISMSPTNSINPTDPDDPMLQLAQFKPPSLLAREDEVKKFFNTYIERYNRMDIEGFLFLFSPKAIQNKKDGPEGIRKIYTDFFGQGKEVRNRIQEMKIEIYQNVVEVRAHYEIEQVLKKGGKKKVWSGQIQWILGKENGVLKIVSLDYQHQKTS
jgi:ketosteroid isomerase-like protein